MKRYLAWLRAVVFERRGLHLKILGIYSEVDQEGPVVHYRIRRELAQLECSSSSACASEASSMVRGVEHGYGLKAQAAG